MKKIVIFLSLVLCFTNTYTMRFNIIGNLARFIKTKNTRLSTSLLTNQERALTKLAGLNNIDNSNSLRSPTHLLSRISTNKLNINLIIPHKKSDSCVDNLEQRVNSCPEEKDVHISSLDYKTFVAIEKIIALIRLLIESQGAQYNIKIHKLSYELNPHFFQTKQGIFLEFKNGHPFSLWTPWGYINIIKQSTGQWRAISDEIISLTKAELYLQGKYERSIELAGPVYKINKIGCLELPDAIEKTGKYNTSELKHEGDYTSPEEVLKLWNMLLGLRLMDIASNFDKSSIF